MSFEVKAMGAMQAEVDSTITPITIKRRAMGPNDVHIEIKKASICHSDIHHIRQEWGPAKGQQVVGHEIAGVVVAKGENVTDLAVGDFVGVGCMVGANCFENGKPTCQSCTVNKDERLCRQRMLGTYGGRELVDGVEQNTLGGYSTDIVVQSHFACKIPEYFHDKLEFAAPILCAGITLYTPLKRAGAGPGKKVAINGIGGLGRFGLAIAKALGAEVYAISRSQSKVAELLEFGCKDVILSTDADQMQKYANFFDIIIDTVSAVHSLNELLALIVPQGQLGIVGGSPDLTFTPFMIIAKDLNVFGSMIGTIEDTKAVLQLCADNKIAIPVEIIKPDYINDAYERVLKSDVKYRFVIDIDELRK